MWVWKEPHSAFAAQLNNTKEEGIQSKVNLLHPEREQPETAEEEEMEFEKDYGSTPCKGQSAHQTLGRMSHILKTWGATQNSTTEYFWGARHQWCSWLGSDTSSFHIYYIIFWVLFARPREFACAGPKVCTASLQPSTKCASLKHGVAKPLPRLPVGAQPAESDVLSRKRGV